MGESHLVNRYSQRVWQWNHCSNVTWAPWRIKSSSQNATMFNNLFRLTKKKPSNFAWLSLCQLGICQLPVVSLHKWSVIRKAFPCDDVSLTNTTLQSLLFATTFHRFNWFRSEPRIQRTILHEYWHNYETNKLWWKLMVLVWCSYPCHSLPLCITKYHSTCIHKALFKCRISQLSCFGCLTPVVNLQLTFSKWCALI